MCNTGRRVKSQFSVNYLYQVLLELTETAVVTLLTCSSALYFEFNYMAAHLMMDDGTSMDGCGMNVAFVEATSQTFFIHFVAPTPHAYLLLYAADINNTGLHGFFFSFWTHDYKNAQKMSPHELYHYLNLKKIDSDLG
uniref:Uncharacterized protein n=1 Tax=Glossina austeni TaxID=7395 RepID=A0A1A9UFC6_GLOAU